MPPPAPPAAPRAAPPPAPVAKPAPPVEASGGEIVATVSDKGGEVSASVDETNRVRALLGMKPLQGSGAPPAASADEPMPISADDGPLLGPAMPAAAAAAAAAAAEVAAETSKAQRAAPDEAAGAKEVMALELSRYTSARCKW